MCCAQKHKLTFDKAEFAQIANALLKLWFLGSVKFRTLLQHLEHTGGIQPKDEEHREGRHHLTGGTSSSQPGRGVVDVFCLGLCEAHIKQGAHGQLCVNFPSRLTDPAVVLRLLQSTVRSGEAPDRLWATFPQPSGSDCGGGVSHSPVINLGKTNQNVDPLFNWDTA